MSNLSPAQVVRVEYSEAGLEELQRPTGELGVDEKGRELLLTYPTVYLIRQAKKGAPNRRPTTSVYVGETTSIVARTRNHLLGDPKSRDDWKELAESARDGEADMFVIGHDRFNKSLTLDIEDRLMTYMLSSPTVDRCFNRRPNPQSQYYTKEHVDSIFNSIWRKLRRIDKDQFPAESVIHDSAIFKASPFHKLTEEQIQAKNEILGAVQELLQSGTDGNLILVTGEAGAGKTVLLSTLFYELVELLGDDSPEQLARPKAHLLVNHDEQLGVYQQISRKLRLTSKESSVVARPTRFLNEHDSPDNKADVVLIDEAHLLWTQGKQSYRGKNQLEDILKASRVVIAVMDQNQVLRINQYWEEDRLDWLQARTTREIRLENQMRISASVETVKWLREFIDEGRLSPLPHDSKYDLRVFDDPTALYEAILRRSRANPETDGLSRMIASYDWEYSSKKEPKDKDMWTVSIGTDFEMPWNRELRRIERRSGKRRRESLDEKKSWAEQEQTINEIGSIYTVQGFDLNYAGVIIGPSVGWEDGHVVFHPDQSQNSDVTNKRTMSDGKKRSVAERLLRNELNVLLTRGVNGLYIYAVDDDLRRALRDAETKGKALHVE